MTESQRLEQAADWLDRIDEFSEQEKLQFAEWLNDAENRSAFNRITAVLGQPEVLAAAQRIHHSASRASAINASDNKVTPLPVRQTHWRKLGIASAAAVALVAVLLSFRAAEHLEPAQNSASTAQQSSWQSQQAEFSTRIGENNSANLSDGSIVYLNGNTTLNVNHNARFREVSLNSGQAYFDIAHEPQRPFIVQLDSASVQVVGTAFDIDRLTDKTEIRVYEGIVKVNADKTLMLHKGEGVILHQGKWQTTFKLDDSQLPDWRTGWLQVSQQPLGDVVTRLNRYTKKPIRITGNSALAVSGRFNLKSPDQALQLLTAMDDISLMEMSDHYQLSVTL